MTRLVVDKNFDPEVFSGASCVFGVFDGVHRGHQFLIDAALADRCPRTVAITFDIDPDEVFHSARLHKLMTNEERLAALEASGVDAVVVLPFTQDLYTLAPGDFLDTLFGPCAPAHLHVGEDFRFGARATGSVEDLKSWSHSRTDQGAWSMEIHAHPLLNADGSPITSTRIRLLLENDQPDEAAALLH